MKAGEMEACCSFSSLWQASDRHGFNQGDKFLPGVLELFKEVPNLDWCGSEIGDCNIHVMQICPCRGGDGTNPENDGVFSGIRVISLRQRRAPMWVR